MPHSLGQLKNHLKLAAPFQYQFNPSFLQERGKPVTLTSPWNLSLLSLSSSRRSSGLLSLWKPRRKLLSLFSDPNSVIKWRTPLPSEAETRSANSLLWNLRVLILTRWVRNVIFGEENPNRKKKKKKIDDGISLQETSRKSSRKVGWPMSRAVEPISILSQALTTVLRGGRRKKRRPTLIPHRRKFQKRWWGRELKNNKSQARDLSDGSESHLFLSFLLNKFFLFCFIAERITTSDR